MDTQMTTWTPGSCSRLLRAPLTSPTAFERRRGPKISVSQTVFIYYQTWIQARKTLYSTDLSLVPALRNTASNTVTSTAISSQRYFLLRRSPGSARHTGTLRRQNIPARRPKSEATARGRESCVNCGNHSNHSNCSSLRLVNCSNYCDSNAVRLIGGQTRLVVPFVPGDCNKGNDGYGASTSLHERSTPRASKSTDWLH